MAKMSKHGIANLVKQWGIGSVKNNTYLQVPRRSSNEILALMKVIDFLSSEVAKTDEPLDIARERDWNKKINERFIQYKPQIMEELEILTPLYKDKYKLAWTQSDISEGKRDEINALLSIKSRNVLSDTDGDPIHALDTLTKWLCDEIAEAANDDQKYSEAAVRFFLHTEFQRCNIFPNGAAV